MDANSTYNVYRSGPSHSLTCGTFYRIAYNIMSLSYDDISKMPTGAAYCYYITATFRNVNSLPSNIVSVVVLGAPSNLVATVN